MTPQRDIPSLAEFDQRLRALYRERRPLLHRKLGPEEAERRAELEHRIDMLEAEEGRLVGVPWAREEKLRRLREIKNALAALKRKKKP